jgi:hypothetical protein
MAFADPQSITIDGTTTSLPRVLTGTSEGRFTSADGSIQIEVLPSTGKTKVRIARLRSTKITSDPLVSTTNIRVSDLVSFNVVRPLDGYADAEVVKQITGFIAWLTASSNANLIKLVAGEN